MKQIATRMRLFLALFVFSGITATTTQAQPYNGLIFNGSTSYVNCGTATVGNFGTSDFTMELWFKTTSSSGTLPLMSKRNSCNHSNFWNLLMASGKIIFEIDQDGAGTNYGSITTPSTYNNGAWHHLACTRSGTAMKTYVDGALVVTGTSAGITNLSNANTMEIGGLACGYYFTGTLDEVRFWNRALCQAEIQNNMNGELPSPAAQAGLIDYYTMDQGTAGGTNTGLNALTDAGSNAISGTLTNFTLTGSTSNYVAGATAITGNATQYSATTPSNIGESLTKAVSAATDFTGCSALGKVTPSGAAPVSGNVTIKMTYDASVQSYTSHAYVQRHYDVTPAANASIATGTITLYYTQADFTAYNAANGIDLDLPTTTSNSDPNIANLRISQYHGTGTAPGNYSGTGVYITPTSVLYQNGRWEVTFPVTGFSGFFATGNLNQALPLALKAFSAATYGPQNRIDWKMGEETSGNTFTITRSANGSNFEPIGTVAGTGAGAYAFYDAKPLAAVNYYRLVLTAPGAEASYSPIAVVRNSTGGSITVAPIPAGTRVVVTNTDAALNGSMATVSNMQGSEVYRFTLAATSTIDISSWAAGVYSLRLPSGTIVRLVKQ